MIVGIVSVVSYSNLSVYGSTLCDFRSAVVENNPSGERWEWSSGSAASESSHYGCGIDLAKQRDSV